MVFIAPPLRDLGRTARTRSLPILLAAGFGCTGAVDAPGGPSGALPGGAVAVATSDETASDATSAEGQSSSALRCSGSPRDVGASMLRRLTLTEAQLTLQDLFGLSEPPPLTGLPLDNQREGFSTFADVQAMSAQHLRAFANLARTLADALLADAPRRAAVVGCNAESASCLREFIARFGRLAHRGRLASADVERYATRAEQNALDPDDRIRYAVQALIASPYFVYRRETGDALEGLSTLAPNELASRLSFGLWGRAPNAALLDQA
ncbi:MAG: hypothetical protein RL385_2724, partial [Pseudomonadota bacterium]